MRYGRSFRGDGRWGWCSRIMRRRSFGSARSEGLPERWSLQLASRKMANAGIYSHLNRVRSL